LKSDYWTSFFFDPPRTFNETAIRSPTPSFLHHVTRSSYAAARQLMQLLLLQPLLSLAMLWQLATHRPTDD